jgi:hypothetical protein
MTFVKVFNKIVKITSSEVIFDNPEAAKKYHGKSAETFLKRFHDKKILWRLMPDGIYVRREYAVSYKLLTD